jgi:hypothetical protein
MNTLTRRTAGFLLAGAVIAAGLTVSQAAYADSAPGTITLYGATTDGGVTRGPIVTSGSATDAKMFYGISIDATCPAGFKTGSQTYAFQGGVSMGGLSTARDGSVTLYGNTGLSAGNVSMSDVETTGGVNPYANSRRLNQLPTPLATGAWELRYYCTAGEYFDINFVTDKYFVLPMTFDAAAQTWAVSGPVAPAEDTTVSLTAAVQGDNSVVLTGTVKDEANATAAAAVGSVEFYSFPANVLVGTGTVAGGVASFQTPILAGGYYQYKAKFVSGDDDFNDSVLSGVASASITGANSAPATITVEIPAGIGALTLTGVPASVSLGTAVLNGGVLEASGNLSGVTVTDTRQLDAPDWSLTGQVSDFTSASNTLLGKYLGWTPSKASGASTSTVGAAVAPAPGSANGIAASAAFGAGQPTDLETVTVFNAALLLKAPANTPAGSYSAILTITLV